MDRRLCATFLGSVSTRLMQGKLHLLTYSECSQEISVLTQKECPLYPCTLITLRNDTMLCAGGYDGLQTDACNVRTGRIM